jgi:hypothetical protein
MIFNIRKESLHWKWLKLSKIKNNTLKGKRNIDTAYDIGWLGSKCVAYTLQQMLHMYNKILSVVFYRAMKIANTAESWQPALVKSNRNIRRCLLLFLSIWYNFSLLEVCQSLLKVTLWFLAHSVKGMSETTYIFPKNTRKMLFIFWQCRPEKKNLPARWRLPKIWFSVVHG